MPAMPTTPASESVSVPEADNATVNEERTFPNAGGVQELSATLLEARALSSTASTIKAQRIVLSRKGEPFWTDKTILLGVMLFVTMNAVAKGILTLMETIATPLYQVCLLSFL